jgi:hypothetical protein
MKGQTRHAGSIAGVAGERLRFFKKGALCSVELPGREMQLPGVDGQGQQFLVLQKNLIKIKAIADNNILRVKNRASKVPAIGAEEYLDQVSALVEVTHHLMYKLHIFHETHSAPPAEMRYVSRETEQTSRQKKAPLFGGQG